MSKDKISNAKHRSGKISNAKDRSGKTSNAKHRSGKISKAKNRTKNNYMAKHQKLKLKYPCIRLSECCIVVVKHQAEHGGQKFSKSI